MEITLNNVAAVKASNEAQYNTSQSRNAQTKKDAAEELPPVMPAATTPSTDRILINKLEGANEEIRVVAKQIRQVDRTMEVIGQNLEKMSAALEGIVKTYPPYLQESKERIAALRQYGGLRKLIDQLTLPPPDDSPSKILGDQKMFPEAGNWEFTAGKRQPPVIIGHQPVHSGADGLDLPELSTDASDEAVRKALGQMTKSHEVLQRRRSAFTAEANRAMVALL